MYKNKYNISNSQIKKVSPLETLSAEMFFGIDIAFVIDSTGSMSSYIEGAKESILDIIDLTNKRFINSRSDTDLIKFGIVAYRDHPPQENTFVTKLHNFSDSNQAYNFLNTLSASGGGDPPEAVLDGLNDAVFNLNWREDSEKIIFLLLDNPGHGIRFGTYYDCICKYHEKDILPAMKKNNIQFCIIKPKDNNTKLDKMISIFSEYINIDIHELEKYSQINFNKKNNFANDRLEIQDTYKDNHKNLDITRMCNYRKNKYDQFNKINNDFSIHNNKLLTNESSLKIKNYIPSYFKKINQINNNTLQILSLNKNSDTNLNTIKETSINVIRERSRSKSLKSNDLEDIDIDFIIDNRYNNLENKYNINNLDFSCFLNKESKNSKNVNNCNNINNLNYYTYDRSVNKVNNKNNELYIQLSVKDHISKTVSMKIKNIFNKIDM